MSKIHFTSDGDTMWLKCFTDNPDAEDGQIIDPVDVGDSWDTFAAKVSEHQAEHGCGEPAKVIVVRDDGGREHRYTAPAFGMLRDGTLLIGDRTGDDLRVDAARAPGRWVSVHKDGVTAPDTTRRSLDIAKAALALIARSNPEDPRKVADGALEQIWAECES